MTIREKVIIDGEDQASAAVDSATRSFTQFEDVVRKAATAGGIVIAARKIRDLAVASTGFAIDAQEAASAFQTTFGPAVDDAGRFVEDFANKAGFAEFQLEQMLSTAGNVAQGIGATEAESALLAQSMATLAGDVASFSNAAGGAESVLMALQSALTGEREALKTYGIAISEAEVQQRALMDTQKSHADELTRLEKAQATVELAYEKAGKAVGDLDRTQGSAANSMRRINALWIEAQTTLGEHLVPALEDALPALEAMVRQFEVIIEDAGPGISKALSGVVTAWEGLLVVFFRVQATDQAQAMADTIVVANELRTSFAGVHNEATQLANGLVALQEKGSLSIDTFEFLAASVGATRDEQILALETLRDYNIANEAAPSTIRRLSLILAGLTQEIEAEEAALRAAADATIGDANELERLGTVARETGREVVPFVSTLDQMYDRLVANETATRNLASAQLAQADPVFRAVDAWSRYQQTLSDVHDDNQITAEEAVELTERSLELRDALDLDPGAWSQAMFIIQQETGLTLSQVEELFDGLGEFDGKSFDASVNLRFNIDDLPPGLGNLPDFTNPIDPTEPFIPPTAQAQAITQTAGTQVQVGDIIVQVVGSGSTSGGVDEASVGLAVRDAIESLMS